MSTQRGLASHPMFYEHIPFEVPGKQTEEKKRRQGRKPKRQRSPKHNVLENVEQ